MAKDKFIKTIWLSIDGTMMRDGFRAMKQELDEAQDANKCDYTIFEPWQTDSNKIYIKINVNDNHYEEMKKIGYAWSYYNPVKVLSKKPKAVNE